MRIILTLLFLYCLAGKASTLQHTSADAERQKCEGVDQTSMILLSSVACLQDKVYRLEYDRKRKEVVLVFSNKKIVLQKFPKERDAVLVGTEKLIGFLADKLQVYKKQNILLYTSSSRTNAGFGGGQCGAGSEIYLNFLDLHTGRPRLKNQILIGSCDYSIELDEQDAFGGKIGDITVEKDKLLFHFLNYKNIDGSPTATITTDMKNFIFK